YGEVAARGRWEVMPPRDARHRRSRAAGARRHLLPVVRVASDGEVDPPGRLDDPPAERDVLLLDLALLELPRQLLLRPVVLGDDHPAGRALVQPVDDAGPQLAADAA